MKHLTKAEWIYFFNLFDKNKKRCLEEYFAKRGFTNKNQLLKYWAYNYFWNKYLKFKSNTIEFKMGKNKQRKQNRKHPKDVLNIEELNWFAEQYIKMYEDGKLPEDEKQKILEKIKQLKHSCRSLSSIGLGSKSEINRIKNNKQNIISDKKIAKDSVKEKLYRTMVEIQEKHNWNLGREPLSIYLRNYGFCFSGRQVGNYMNTFGVFCQLKLRTRKPKEIKTTSVHAPNVANRDFKNVGSIPIYSTDTTFIKISRDNSERFFVYLTASISWKSKRIESFDISKTNDLSTVMKTVKGIKANCQIILHSDHGYQYTSHEYKQYLIDKKWIYSLSRVGDSIDNRPIEYFFKILKTELLYKLDLTKMSFEKIKLLITNFIDYYNNVRIQKNLNWLAPNQYARKYNCY